ncbi:alpha/beta fold hydrolase [Asticcacaulis sp. EMRT-3]|uniref:alpha/beta fold hydrolase n=1 Tax=Asticcacaulis sp. EMRT-3 TaxID=3040349 RepID=UPI0024AFDEC4|nr:alpha/beta fold hydrolase [Asticcacaulis sp. EMRT-3]MDI7775659.1 alpha/beta fold hydrolase [Asticcacaulis sp. EMRT-3]
MFTSCANDGDTRNYHGFDVRSSGENLPASQGVPDITEADGPDARQLLVRRPDAYADRWWQSEDGLRLYARDYPAVAGRVRLPVICLHGMTRNSADFDEVAPYIAAMERRVIVPDFRGRGLSENDPDASHYHLWAYARDVLSLCDALGIGQAVFIGNSMGGLVTMVLSTLRANLIRAAVLNDVGPALAPKGLARLSELADQPQVAMRTWPEAAAVMAEQNGAHHPKFAEADWLKFARRAYRKGRDGLLHLAYDPRITAAFKSLTVAIDHYDLMPCYASLAAARPLLLIHGKLSDLLGEDEIAVMTAMSDHLTRADVSHVGHAPLLTETQARLALQDFLTSLA